VRRRLAWLVALPLMLAGSQVAHAFAYALVYPQSGVRLRALAETGHGYLAWLPLTLGIAVAIALVALAGAVVDTARGRPVRPLPASAFAVLPPAAFALQELLELSLHTATLGWRAVLAPTFWPGLLLQLPLAALAYFIARFLLHTAESIGRALARPPRVSELVELLDVPRDAICHGRFAFANRAARAPPCAVVT
jgi:hypothetical protein